jgi:hypothetical protein
MEGRFRNSPDASQAFFVGLQAGVARAARHNLVEPAPPSDIGPLRWWTPPLADAGAAPEFGSSVRYTHDLLISSASSARFNELFGEMLATATIARHAYGDRPLEDPEISTYLEQSFSWFNSFRHA